MSVCSQPDGSLTLTADDGSGRSAVVPAGTAPAERAAQIEAFFGPSVDLNAYAARAHGVLRDGGVTIAGMRVKTDSESRSLITGAYSLSEAKPDAVTDFKAASGWISLNAAQMQTVAIGVGMWVQACYSAYRAIGSGIASGAITTPAQIDAAFAAVTLPV